jgi:6-phosphogluconolactonase
MFIFSRRGDMHYFFYAGCYTSNPRDKGIHLLGFDTDSGILRLEDSFYGGENPSFLLRSGNFLYTANETGRAGMVSALSVGDQNALTFLNSRECDGAGTCHVAEMNGYLYAANYESGSIFGVEILPDGSLGGVVAEIQHEGSGPNPDRQKGPHAHSVNPVPGANLLIAADLGIDKLFCYNQRKDGSLVSDSVSPIIPAPAGGGPRHIAIHPDGKLFYAVMELGVSLACYKLTKTGVKQEAVYHLIEGAFTHADTAADIHFTGDGTRLYVSVRGKNLISVFSTVEGTSPCFIGSYPTFGDSPRNFCFSPGEEFVLIAHQASGHVIVCPIDSQTGAVGNALGSVILPGASCVIKAVDAPEKKH